MQQELRRRIDVLLGEAQQVTDPVTSGLMDRADCQGMVAKLSEAIYQLMEADELGERKREELAMRLSRGLYHPA